MQHDPARDAEILKRRKQGQTLREIGAAFGITMERVRQILPRIERRRAHAKWLEDQRRAADAAMARMQRSPALAITIDELELGVRLYNGLKHARITTVGQLIEMSPAQLLGIKNLGRTSLAELQAELARLGVGLRETPRWPSKKPFPNR